VLLDVIDQPAGGRDDDVGALLQQLALLVVIDAAVDQRELQAQFAAELDRVLVDLDRQLAGRGQDQRARVLGLAVGQRRLGQQAVDHRDQERQRLAGAGLRLASDVAAGQGQRQGQRLDRRGARESGGLQAGQEARVQVERGEGDVGKGLVAHVFLMSARGSALAWVASAKADCRGRSGSSWPLAQRLFKPPRNAPA
jgi:hypothetical protein